MKQIPFPVSVTTFVPYKASHNYTVRATGAPSLHHSFECSHCGGVRMSRACKAFRQRIFTSLRTVGAGSTELRG